MRSEGYPDLPPGYLLDEADSDILKILRMSDGTVIAYFSAQGTTKETIEEAAWEDYKKRGTRAMRRTRNCIHRHRECSTRRKVYVGFIASLWLFMVVSGVCALVAAWYIRSRVQDFSSMAWAIFVIAFVWAVANVLWFMLVGSLFGGY